MELIGATAFFFLIALALPALRLRVRTGDWGIVFRREADPFQRLVGGAFSLYLGGVAAWPVLHALLGPARLDVWSAPRAVAAAGWALVALGSLFVVVAQVAMGTSWRIGIDDRPTGLVTSGPFRVVRNPIFSAMLVMLAGVVLITPSPWTIMGWVGAALLIAVQVRLEEQHLARLHGDAYRAYAARVGRFVPGVGRTIGRAAGGGR